MTNIDRNLHAGKKYDDFNKKPEANIEIGKL